MLSHTLFKSETNTKILSHNHHSDNTCNLIVTNISTLIIYILSKGYNKPNLGKTLLCSILYFIDSNYYELYGKLLTDETYIKSKKGIKPKHFQEITQEQIAKKQLFLRKEPYYNRTIHRYYPTIIP